MRAVGTKDVRLSVTPTGTPPWSYQWRQNGVEIDGATGASLSFPNLQLNHGGTYSVVVKNAGGTVTSAEAVLTVVQITTPPESQTVVAGQAAKFWVVADSTGSIRPWRFKIA